MSLEVHTLPITAFQQNCRIIFAKEFQGSTKKAVIIDPGGHAAKIKLFLDKIGAECHAVWLTHSHIDHCGGVSGLIEYYPNLKLFCSKGEKVFRQNVISTAKMYGIPVSENGEIVFENCPEPDESKGGGYIQEGDNLIVPLDENDVSNGIEFSVISAPGHSPDHMIFYSSENRTLIAGDTLFNGSIGRTDLPMGNHETLIASIHEKILTLPNDTVVLTGHGENTTIANEKLSNPFL